MNDALFFEGEYQDESDALETLTFKVYKDSV